MKRRAAVTTKPAPQTGRQVLPVGMVSVCIGCGCDDLHACPRGCSWLRVDRDLGQGVCSECGHLVEDWDSDNLLEARRAA
jgi:hypothetical protein